MDYFSNKIVIVTGGGSGIGKEICLFFARHGSVVIVSDRNLDSANKTAQIIQNNGGQAEAYQVDVTHPQEMDNLIHQTLNQHGHLDFLFNNAGISVNGEFQDISLEHWKRIYDVNLWGVVYGCQYACPIMIKQGFGHIVNVASLAGLIPAGPFTPYTSSKHAVVGFSQALRAEGKLHGVKVSTLCPGYFKTNIQNSTENVSDYMKSEKSEKTNQSMNFMTPDKKIGQMMRGVKRNKSIIVSPKRQKIFWFLYRCFPSLIPYIFSKIIAYLKKK